jgi:hypothetical protein
MFAVGRSAICFGKLIGSLPDGLTSPKTWNSHSDTPHWVARWVVIRRTYRPLPDTGTVCLPPVPVVAEYTVDHWTPTPGS